MKKQDEYAHGCLICIGTGKLCVVIDGHSNGPTDCSGCDASGRVDKETFMKQLKHPIMKYVNNLAIIKLYEEAKKTV